MSEQLQQQEIDRINKLPEKVDPFTVLGIEVFVPREVKKATEEEGAAASAATTAPENTSAAASSLSARPSTLGAKRGRGGGGGGGDDEEQPDWVRAPIALRDVTRAYRKLSLLLHPDKCSLPGASDAFHKLTLANNKLPSEVRVERFLIELEQMKRRDWDMERRRALAAEERRKKLAATGSVSGRGATSAEDEGNGIAGFSTMSMAEKIAAIAEKERKEKSEELSRKADALAKRQAEDRAKAAEAKARGEELAQQAAEWAGYMDL